MLGTDRIVGAQLSHTQRFGKMVLDVAGLLDKAAQGAFCVRRSGVDEEAVSPVLRIDALPERTGGIAAPHRQRLDEEVCQRM